jgi:type I restriction enzyme S subunit
LSPSYAGKKDCSLGEIGGGGQYGLNAAAMGDGGGTRFIRITDIDDQGQLGRCPPAFVPNSIPGLHQYELTEGDILIARSGATAGKSYIHGAIHEKSVFAGYLIRFKIDPKKALSKYVFRFLQTDDYWRQLRSHKRAVAQPNVNAKQLSSICLPLPPLPEQKRIVAILDAAEELRRLRQQADRRTADLVPALFHEMFGDPATNPKGWPLVPVSEIVAELQGGKSIAADGDGSTLCKYRVLKVSAVTWKTFKPEESKPVPRDYDPPVGHFVRQDDLLFSRANTSELVGATAYVFKTPSNLLLPDKLWRFVWHEPRKADPAYVWSLFLDPAVRRELGLRASGTSGSMKNISKPKVMSMKIPLPPLSVQRDFAARVAGIRSMEANQAASRHRLENLFQSLLHRAFKGEL